MPFPPKITPKKPAAAAAVATQKIQIKLKNTTKPKFMHNASKAGTKPVWTFEYEDMATHKKQELKITMTNTMTKDENAAKKVMADEAIKQGKKEYPGAEVTMVSSTL